MFFKKVEKIPIHKLKISILTYFIQPMYKIKVK